MGIKGPPPPRVPMILICLRFFLLLFYGPFSTCRAHGSPYLGFRVLDLGFKCVDLSIGFRVLGLGHRGLR